MVHGTMNHLLGGDEIWYGRINGSEVPKDIFPIYLLDGVELGRKWEERYENRNELFEKLIGQCDRWIELLKDKDDACDRYHRRSAYSYGCYPRERRRNQKFQSRPLDGVEVYFPPGANPG